MLRSHRLERLISGSERPRVPTENRGFVMKKTFTGKSSLSMLLCFAGLLSFAAPIALSAGLQRNGAIRVADAGDARGRIFLFVRSRLRSRKTQKTGEAQEHAEAAFTCECLFHDEPSVLGRNAGPL